VRHVLLAAGSLAALAGLWAIAHHFVLSMHYADSDFFTFWLGGRFVVSGLDPYDPALWTAAHGQYGAVWIPNPAYVYPLPLAVLMAPLGAMDLLTAYNLWVILSALMLLAACWIIFGRPSLRSDMPYLIPWLAGALLFRPAIVTLRNGQFGGFLLLVLVGGTALAARRRDGWAGVVFGLLSLKPALGLPILGLVAVWMLSRRRWRFIAGLLTSLILLFLLGWLYDPHWVSRLAGSGSPKLVFNVGYFPTAWGLGTALCAGRGTCAWWAGAGLSGAALLAFGAAVYVKRSSLETWGAASLVVPVALFASPYVGAYDLLLLLLPIGVSLRCLRVRGTPYLIVASLPIWIDLASLILVLVAARVGLDLWSATLDLLTLTLVWWALELPPFDQTATPRMPAS